MCSFRAADSSVRTERYAKAAATPEEELLERFGVQSRLPCRIVHLGKV